jgi:hypothetical protein
MTDEDLAQARNAQRAGDHATAVAIYRRWAEHGDVRAQDELGVIYENGSGVTKSYAEAAKWYRRAAEKGYAPAQNNLGVMYETGHGVVRDTAEAAKWYLKAAEKGRRECPAQPRQSLSERRRCAAGLRGGDRLVSQGGLSAAPDGAGQSRRDVRARSRHAAGSRASADVVHAVRVVLPGVGGEEPRSRDQEPRPARGEDDA